MNSCAQAVIAHAQLHLYTKNQTLSSMKPILSLGACQTLFAQAAEVRKHTANGQRCTDLGWSCIPLAVESYGARGREAQMCFTLLATRLAVRTSSSKSKMTFDLVSSCTAD